MDKSKLNLKGFERFVTPKVMLEYPNDIPIAVELLTGKLKADYQFLPMDPRKSRVGILSIFYHFIFFSIIIFLKIF
jgi:hypothetical protein